MARTSKAFARVLRIGWVGGQLCALLLVSPRHALAVTPPEVLQAVAPSDSRGSTKAKSFDWVSTAVELERQQAWQALQEHGLRWSLAEPNNATAWVSLAEAEEHLGNNTQSLADYKTARDVAPGNAIVWSALGGALLRLKQYDEASRAYAQALKIDPKNLASQLGMMKVAHARSLEPRALEALLNDVAQHPDNAQKWSELATTYLGLDQYDLAIYALRNSLRIDPKREEAWTTLGATYAIVGNRDGAVEAYQALRGIHPGIADTMMKMWMDVLSTSAAPSSPLRTSTVETSQQTFSNEEKHHFRQVVAGQVGVCIENLRTYNSCMARESACFDRTTEGDVEAYRQCMGL